MSRQNRARLLRGNLLALLAASNYSLRLYAQDISQAMCNCIEANAYLYMPWMVFQPDFSRFGGPTWEQVEEAMFGQPEPAGQGEIVQLPLFLLL